MKLTTLLFLGLSSLTSSSLARLIDAGVWGEGPTDELFDDRFLYPVGPYKSVSLECKWGRRLDYFAFKYFGTSMEPLTIAAHGNINAGSHTDHADFVSPEDITGINVYVCNDKKYKGQICGMFVAFKERQPFFCGNLNEGGARGEYKFENTRFHAFLGATKDNGKSITRLGFTATEHNPDV